MKEIQIFSSPQFGQVRIQVDASNEPLFCLVDIAKALGYSNPAKAVIDHCKGVTILETPTNGGIQKMKFGKEGEMYRLILKSNAPMAETFQSWVCDEVLPSIRKQGGYMVAKADESPEEIMARALQIANDTLARREARLHQLESENEFQKKELQEAAPKVNYYDQTLQSVNTLTTTQIAKELGLDAQKLNQRLKKANVIFRQSGMWMLHQPYSSWNLAATRTQTYTRSDGSTGTSVYTVWNERGRRFIHALHKYDYNTNKARKEVASL